MDISVIVPLLNEEESLPELCQWIERVMKENNFTYEILLIDDGSYDNSWNVIKLLHQSDSRIKGIKFRRNYGKSAALNTGFKTAAGDVVITMDAVFAYGLEGRLGRRTGGPDRRGRYGASISDIYDGARIADRRRRGHEQSPIFLCGSGARIREQPRSSGERPARDRLWNLGGAGHIFSHDRHREASLQRQRRRFLQTHDRTRPRRGDTAVGVLHRRGAADIGAFRFLQEARGARRGLAPACKLFSAQLTNLVTADERRSFADPDRSRTVDAAHRAAGQARGEPRSHPGRRGREEHRVPDQRGLPYLLHDRGPAWWAVHLDCLDRVG